jgi:mannose-6-phosphate isomerase-like protein (cupin superfamily)
MSYQTNIVQETNNNPNFRKVLFTGKKSQLVVMTIPPGGEIGAETHENVEQTLFFLSGSGKSVLDGVEAPVAEGDVTVVTPGTNHNFINTGTEDLKIYTIYAPANHIDGRIHATKKDADADTADEDFGHAIGG